MQNIQRPTSYTKSRTKTFDLVITAILAALVLLLQCLSILSYRLGKVDLST